MKAVVLVAFAATVCAATYGYAAGAASPIASRATPELSQIGARQAWPLVAGHRAPPIAILDTGVDGGTIAARDFVDMSSGTPTSSHGTAVASITTEVCPACTIVSATVLDARDRGDDVEIARALRWAVASGARVVNLSLTGADEARVLRAAIHTATRRGVVVVAAAGNDGSTAKTFPAADPDVIGVAATTSSGTLFSWSNRGPWITVAAPGHSAALVGTSAAAPAVAAAAAECLAVSPGLSPAAVRRILGETAIPVDRMPFGRLDVARAVRACASA